jgi:hypothetical protein
MSKRYTTEEHIQRFLQRELTDQEAVLVDYAITEASDEVKAYAGRNWKDIGDNSETEEEVRTFNGNGNTEIFIDDFESISKIEVLDGLGNLYKELETTDYLIYPSGAIGSSIAVTNWHFPRGSANIRLTGKFSSGPVPDGAILAATKLAAQVLMKSGDNSGSFKKESIEGYSYEVADSPIASEPKESILSSLDKYRKIAF